MVIARVLPYTLPLLAYRQALRNLESRSPQTILSDTPNRASHDEKETKALCIAGCRVNDTTSTTTPEALEEKESYEEQLRKTGTKRKEAGKKGEDTKDLGVSRINGDMWTTSGRGIEDLLPAPL